MTARELDHRGDAYRAVYTVRFEGAVYVLHVSQKKSPSGVKTPRSHVNLIGKDSNRPDRIMRGGMAQEKSTPL